MQRGEGLPERTSGVTEKAACPQPVTASPCPIRATAGLVSSSTQPCSAQDQVLLIWASQQSHQRGDSRTTQLPSAQELPQQEPQGSCQVPFPVQLLSPASTLLSLVSWALTLALVAEGSSRPQASHQERTLQQPLLLCAHPRDSPDLEEMAAPQIQFEEYRRNCKSLNQSSNLKSWI